MSALTKRIKKLMTDRQMTVKMLFDKCDISSTHLYDILGGNIDHSAVSLGVLEQIAKGLDVKLVELLIDSDLKDIKSLRQLLTEEDISIIERLESLADDDWRRQAILHTLGIESPNNPHTESSNDDPDGQ